MDSIVRRKLADAQVPGCIVEFDPDEAAQVGAFEDDAISLDDAQASAPDFLSEEP